MMNKALESHAKSPRGPKLASCLLGALLALSGCQPAPAPSSAAGPEAAAGDAERFQCVRARKLILRIDSSVGTVWLVDENGDGGWTMLGATPDDDDLPTTNGRYGLFALNKGGIAGGPTMLLREDRANGRSWIAPAREGNKWAPIREGQARAPEPAADGQAASADGQPVALQVVSREVIEASPGNESEKVAVVVQALQKEGLAVEIKVWADSQLSVFSPEAAVPPLLDALSSEHPEVVVAAIESLRTIGQGSTIPKILALSSHPDSRVRAAVDRVIDPVP